MKNLFLLFVCLLVFVTAAEAAHQPLALTTAQNKVTAEFTRLDNSLKKAALELGKTGISGDNARRILATTCEELSYAIDCATVDTLGRMTTVEPEKYRSFEGKDISAQKQVKRILKTRKPVLSAVFRSVEGDEAVDAEFPIFSPDGHFIGSISVLFKPEQFLGDIIKPILQGIPMDIWVMERGGRLLYDVDPAQIGLNLFTSPEYHSYKQVVRLAKKIARTPQGSGVYRFKKATLDGPEVNKKAYWQSVGLYGTAWRLVGIHLEQNTEETRGRRPAPAAAAEQLLDQFASDTALTAALSAVNKDRTMKLFKRFYEATPDIYSVQWIDPKGVNRFGYPTENSLSGYDYSLGSNRQDKEILQIAMKQQPTVFEAFLLEGRTGAFVFKPVFRDGQYLGMVYTIKLKAY